ncbi:MULTISPECIES: helix-turn-helix transcriptional regulator [Staphylococcus]|uniref:helix-turn-helix transcriptional regulator n=1 Tax=Staphylococcus TaxID=1279 RepID=UPI0004A10DFC|nr:MULTISPECIES: helix-turn-helix transcriptional regulator [Staphylococcus]KDE96216.1 hypothetical protein CM54_04070 [Staphylococcus sp. TE8]MDM7465225.1 helix-turn-helix transcriptional regulator [Staphylococcus warneri]MDW3946290.1 helix-turn-helix transcriptional regulator [Staphylococcus saprophyticus]MDW4234712.1 helix-turn-helix transcriptional regulator [Staphylococcus saprophyticus]
MKLYAKGNLIRELMFYKGINLHDLSSIINCSYSHLSYILNEQRPISPKLAKKIADYFETPIKEAFQIIEEVK